MLHLPPEQNLRILRNVEASEHLPERGRKLDIQYLHSGKGTPHKPCHAAVLPTPTGRPLYGRRREHRAPENGTMGVGSGEAAYFQWGLRLGSLGLKPAITTTRIAYSARIRQSLVVPIVVGRFLEGD